MRNKELDRELNECFKGSDALIIVALMFLSNNRNSLVPEIMSFLDLEALKKFLYIYGGETITVPSVKEFEFQLTCAITLYYKEIRKRKWTWIQEKLQIEDQQFGKVKDACIHFLRSAKPADIEFLNNIKDQGEVL